MFCKKRTGHFNILEFKKMKRIYIFIFLLLLPCICCLSQGFTNPVLPGFHADPSVCRVGDDFYLVNSTFQYFPSVPVYHSKDLIHWQQIGACLTRLSQVNLEGADGNSGIYAPTIRYHDGKFYMITTQFPSRKHFYVYTNDPAGEWSDPITIDFTIGSCDPTLFFDEGKCYFLWKDEYIKICEIDIETGNQLSEIRQLWSGLGGRYPEGPHIYKKDGYYYLMIAEGGTEHGHHVTIARSRLLYGPYTPCPANPILSHFSKEMQNSPIQGLGHADLIQAPDESWWMICLGYRTHGYLQHVMGRETFLAPVRWDKDAWPVVNGNGTIQIEMNCPTLPQIEMPQEPEKDDFSRTRLELYWSWLCNPDFNSYSLSARKGYLRLKATPISINQIGSPTFIGRRQTEINFRATTFVDFSKLQMGSQAGLTAYASHTNHYDVLIEKRNGKSYVQANIRIGQMEHVEKEIQVNTSTIYLRIEADRNFYYLLYSTDNKTYDQLAKMEYRYLSTETIGGFTGVHLGLFVQSKDKADNSFADCDWFEYITY